MKDGSGRGTRTAPCAVAWGRGGRRCLWRWSDCPAAPLDEDGVAPAAVMPADAVAPAHLPEPGRAVQGEARGVLGEDAGLDRPDARGLRRPDQGPQQAPPDAQAAGSRVDVNRVLDDARVDAPGGNGGR